MKKMHLRAGRPGRGDPRLERDLHFILLGPPPLPSPLPGSTDDPSTTHGSPHHVHHTRAPFSVYHKHMPTCPSVPKPRPLTMDLDRLLQGEAPSLCGCSNRRRTVSAPQPSSIAGRAAPFRSKVARLPSGYRSSQRQWRCTWRCSIRLHQCQPSIRTTMILDTCVRGLASSCLPNPPTAWNAHQFPTGPFSATSQDRDHLHRPHGRKRHGSLCRSRQRPRRRQRWFRPP